MAPKPQQRPPPLEPVTPQEALCSVKEGEEGCDVSVKRCPQTATQEKGEPKRGMEPTSSTLPNRRRLLYQTDVVYFTKPT